MLPVQPDEPELLASAQQALEHWPLEVTDLQLISHTENVVFRATTSDARSYVVRIHRPGYSSLAALESERQWTAALRASGVRVPTGIPTAAGHDFAPVELRDGSIRQVGILEWVDGPLLADVIEESVVGDLSRHYEALGRVASHIHNQSSQWQPPPGFTRRAWDSSGLMGEQPLWGPFWDLPGLTPAQRALLRRVRHHIYRVLQELPTGPDVFSLIHSDLHPQNVVVRPDGLWVIDFDDSGFGWHIFELAVVLFRAQGRRYFEAARAALVRGYRSQRSLSDEQLNLLPLFMLIRGLAVLGWANARPELGLDERMQPFRARILGETEAYLAGRLM